jgi:hypothetical protein
MGLKISVLFVLLGFHCFAATGTLLQAGLETQINANRFLGNRLFTRTVLMKKHR